jgi:hypothetical protein
MSKAEKFIQEYTRNCSNEYLTDSKPDGLGGYISRRNFSPWLTPDQALRAVEIAREEMLNRICEWIEENIGEYCDGENIMFSATYIENIDIFGQESFINDLKQAMKDE